MKKILYLYLLLISAPIFSMQPVKKNQIPMNNNRVLINAERAGGALLIGAALISTPLCIVAPPVGILVLGTGAKMGAMMLGTQMILDANERANNK